MGLRFNPAPGWPPPPPGFVPPPHWQPDPSWPPAPPGWQLWVDDGVPDPLQATGPPPWAVGFGTGADEAPPWAGGLTSGAEPGPFAPQDPFTQQMPGPVGDVLGAPERRARATGKANRLAVASALLGLIGVTVIGAIASVACGISALRQIRRTGQRGRGLAITGLVLSALWLALLGAVLAASGGKSPTRPAASTGHSSPPSQAPSPTASPGSLSVNVFALRPGQCFQNPTASQSVLGVSYVTVVPCGTPHNAQAFVQFNATGTSYPGVESLKRQADTGCHARIRKNVQTSKIKATMTLHYLYPLDTSWAAGHRTITCMIVNAKPNLTTSLLRTHPAQH